MKGLIKFSNRIRRESMKLINKNYVQNKLKKRKGECEKCGKCCIGCKFLGKNNICTVYKKRPWFCYPEFPLDKTDQKVFQVKKCGYSFKK